MKKFVTILISLVLILPCVACGSAPDEKGVDIEVYFDTVNFVAGMSQTMMREQAEQYLYEGTPLEEILSGVHYDGESGGGYSARDTEEPRRFGFGNDYHAYSDQSYALYTNTLFTTVPLEGLAMPEGVKFGDTLSKVLEKFSFTKGDFYTDIDDPTTKILRKDIVHCFYLIDNSQKADADYPKEFSYEETTAYTDASEREREVVRSLTLEFDQNDKLVRMIIAVTERIPLQ